MSLKTNLTLTIKGDNRLSRDMSISLDPISASIIKELADGSGANQANRIFADIRELANGASEVINLSTFAVDAGAAPTDNLGQTYALTGIKLIVIESVAVGAVVGPSLTIGGEGSADEFNSPFNSVDGGVILLAKDGLLVLYNPSATGWAVGTGNKLLKVLNSGAATGNYRIIVVGAQ